jgi:dihydrofolate reductase
VTRGKTTFTFVDEGIKSALAWAEVAAGERTVVLQGANIARQYLEAGLLDEIRLHLVPVLLDSRDLETRSRSAARTVSMVTSTLPGCSLKSPLP